MDKNFRDDPNNSKRDFYGNDDVNDEFNRDINQEGFDNEKEDPSHEQANFNDSTERVWYDDDITRNYEEYRRQEANSMGGTTNQGPYPNYNYQEQTARADFQNKAYGQEQNSRYDYRPNQNYGYDQNHDGGYYERENSNKRAYSDFENVDIRSMVKNEVKKSKRMGWLKTIALVLVGAIIGSLVGLGVGDKGLLTKGTQGEERTTQTSGQKITINTSGEKSVENAVAQKASPSVVGIMSSIRSRISDDFSRFFNNGDGRGLSQTQEILGSGVIVSEDGYILTNSHVVNNGELESDITVVFNDKSEAKGKLLWYDQALDLAIIKVDKKNLTAMDIADSSKLEVGDKAIAIGNPLAINLQGTLTSGYISGLDRSITMQDGSVMDGLIQTDAAINGGNSGGALLNSKGELIGINTAKAQTADGIGFSIPINVAMPIVEQVIKTGSFRTPYLGIRGIGLQNYKTYYPNEKFAVDQGVYVADVVKNSCADQAGLRVGDVIVKLGDVEIRSMSELKRTLIKYSYGDKVKISYYSKDKLIEKEVTLVDIDSIKG